jgi:hypothetical protein
MLTRRAVFVAVAGLSLTSIARSAFGEARVLGPNVRFVVRLGSMRNSTGIRSDEMLGVLQGAARSRVRMMQGAAVVAEGDAALLRQASARRVPIVTIEGSLTRLAESSAAGGVQVQARVEFLVRRGQLLKSTLTGGATTFGTTPTLSDLGRRRLQDDEVDGAVQRAEERGAGAHRGGVRGGTTTPSVASAVSAFAALERSAAGSSRQHKMVKTTNAAQSAARWPSIAPPPNRANITLEMGGPSSMPRAYTPL